MTGVTPLIKPLASSVTTTAALGSGIGSAVLPIAQTAQFTIIPKDRYGNNLTDWSDVLTITVQTLVASVSQDLSNPTIYAPSDVGNQVVDYPSAGELASYLFEHPDAPYSDAVVPTLTVKQLKAAYTPLVAGLYYVSILVNNKHLTQSPYLVHVAPGSVGVSLPVAYAVHPNYCKPIISGVSTCTTVEGQGLRFALKPGSADAVGSFSIVVRCVTRTPRKIRVPLFHLM